MSGIEVAGLILAVIPLLLPALASYKSSLSRASVLFRRRKHVEKLIHALYLQKALLTENVRTLLIRVGVDVDEVPEDPQELFDFLQNASGLVARIDEYLGPETRKLYQHAVATCEEVVRKVATHIEGFLPAGQLSQPGSLSAFLKANVAYVGRDINLKARFSLTLGRSDVDKSIQDLNQSILVIERLSTVIATSRDSAENSISRTAAKFASFVATARSQAVTLYSAFAHGWTCRTHPIHEVKLVLDRKPPALTRVALKACSDSMKEPIFDVMFQCELSGQSSTGLYWHEGKAEVLGDPSLHSSSTPTTTNKKTKVTIALSAPARSPPATSQKVSCLCTSLHNAITADKMLRLYVVSPTAMQYEHYDTVTASKQFNVRSMQQLLSNHFGASRRIPLRDRMLLALSLAVSLLQLYETPWLSHLWSKETIQFMEHPCINGAAPNPPTVDFSKPFIACEFAGQLPSVTPDSAPKETLLELGIMLLELWHEKTIEDEFTGSPIPTEYWGRLRLASIWLEDMTNPLLPQYRLAVAQCIKCFFGGAFGSPKWENFEFRKALVKDVVEPLHENCKPWL